MEQRNKKGQTLQEFLQAYDSSRYPHSFLTSDICIFDLRADGLYVLLIRRGDHPFIHRWALPGGFVGPEETPMQAAHRELLEETGLAGIPLRQCGAFGRPDRDPRARILTVAHWGLLPPGAAQAVAGDDAADASWFAVNIKKRQNARRQEFTIDLHSHERGERFSCHLSRIQDELGWQPAFMQGEGTLACDHDEVLFCALMGFANSGRGGAAARQALALLL